MGLSEVAIKNMLNSRQLDSSADEAGGMLIGRLIVGTKDVVIDEITMPTKRDHRGRYLFMRSRWPAQKLINDVWKSSNGTLNYLGEWHTHPEDNPFPSQQDSKNWHKISKTAFYHQGFLLFLIVGRQTITAWEVEKKSGRMSQLFES